MMDSVQPENVTGDDIIDANVDIILGECVEQVDIPGTSNFEEVASKLKDAMEVVASSRHSITAVVADGDRFWVLTIVYANPSVVTRCKLWGYLSAIRNCFKRPWVVMGDFNEITNSVEKRGGRGYFSNSRFVDWINENKLVDLDFIGQKYTWMTRRGVSEDIWVRIDRALCSMEWRVSFG
ncbi:hypothetical protein Dsin_001329 [Dipteronia sinensis]|uniref:Endonuclease/exonuclease/phosphatase domain-containing protein n=1 Tax=Dipteronia sinensis TaxID=43782 RepID=A0AAE0EI88_9ROSI|nr:hypothetical protein Dsin_001329 [Dipteronia sinensis]